MESKYSTCSSLCSEEDRRFVLQSTEQELVGLFRTLDELLESQQEVENRLDETEDTELP